MFVSYNVVSYNKGKITMETIVHKRMTNEMLKLLDTDSLRDVKEFFEDTLNGDICKINTESKNRKIDIITNGSYIEDTTAGPRQSNGASISPWFEHFWTQELSRWGMNYVFAPAYIRAQDYWDDFIKGKKWKDMHSDEKEKALLFLGRIIHLSQDMGTPAHVNNDLHPCIQGINCENYEKYTQKQCKTSLPARFGIQENDVAIFHEQWNDIIDFFYDLALETRKYDSDDVNGTGSGYPYRWGFGDLSDYACDTIAQNMMPLSHCYTAGLLIKFCKELDVFSIENEDEDEIQTQYYDLSIHFKTIKVADDQDTFFEGEGIAKVINGAAYNSIEIGDIDSDDTRPLNLNVYRRGVKKGDIPFIYFEIHDEDATLNDLIGKVEISVDISDYQIGTSNVLTYNKNGVKLTYTVSLHQAQTETKRYDITTYLDTLHVINDQDSYGSGELFVNYYDNASEKRYSLGDKNSGETYHVNKKLGEYSRTIYNYEDFVLSLEIKDDDVTTEESLGRIDETFSSDQWLTWLEQGEYTTNLISSEHPNYFKASFRFEIYPHNNMGVGTQVKSYDWSSGWDNIAFYEVGGQTYLFLLKSSNGIVHIHKMNSDGTVGTQVKSYDWSSGWDNIAFYEVGGQTYLFLLKSSNGVAHLHQMNSNGTVGRGLKEYDWTSGWNNIGFYKINGVTYLFLLKSSNGIVHIHKMNQNASRYTGLSLDTIINTALKQNQLVQKPKISTKDLSHNVLPIYYYDSKASNIVLYPAKSSYLRTKSTKNFKPLYLTKEEILKLQSTEESFLNPEYEHQELKQRFLEIPQKMVESAHKKIALSYSKEKHNSLFPIVQDMIHEKLAATQKAIKAKKSDYRMNLESMSFKREDLKVKLYKKEFTLLQKQTDDKSALKVLKIVQKRLIQGELEQLAINEKIEKFKQISKTDITKEFKFRKKLKKATFWKDSTKE